MARIIVTGFPDPPEGCLWCSACAAFAKGELMRDPAVQERARAALEDDDREVVAIAAPVDLRGRQLLQRLELAVTQGTHPSFGLAVVGLCWTHAPAIDASEPPPAPPQQQLLRGLS